MMRENCRVLEIEHPILDCQDMDKIKNLHKDGFQPYILSTLFYRGMPLKDAIDHLFVEADRAYRDGANIFILSDRGVDESHMAIPSLLAVSALEQHLIRTKKKRPFRSLSKAASRNGSTISRACLATGRARYIRIWRMNASRK